MPITSKQRAYLRGLAMNEETIIQIGKGGITDNVVLSVVDALKARELIKGRCWKARCFLRAKPATSCASAAPPSRYSASAPSLSCINATKKNRK